MGSSSTCRIRIRADQFELEATPGRAARLGSWLAAERRHALSVGILVVRLRASIPNRISVEDIVATAALDTGVSGEAVLGVDAIRHDPNETLVHIPVATTFWQLPVKDFDERPSASGTVSWWVWRAWALLIGLTGVDRAITHKLLHRKRPWLFPMLDSVTSAHLGGFRAWATIWEDLARHEQEFAGLEDWFAALASAHDGVRLTSLRIHDIMLWGELSGTVT